MPTSSKDILTAFRAELIPFGIVRRPSEAGPATPMHVDPVRGAPAPGEMEGIEDNAALVLSIFPGGEIPPAIGMGATIATTVDIHYRGHDSKAIMDKEAAIYAALVNPAGDGMGYRFNFTLGGILGVIDLRQYSGLTRLGADPAQGFHYKSAYYVQAIR